MAAQANTVSSSKGFTLIELLVALSVAAAISVMAYRALDSAIDANEKVTEISQSVDDVDRVWQYLRSDLLVAQGRTWKNSYGEARSAFMGAFGDRLSQSDVLVVDEDSYLLQFVRGDGVNLLDTQRSSLSMVGYRLSSNEDGETKSLWRDSWWPIDGSGDESRQQRLLIDNVQELSFRYLPSSVKSLDDGAWVTGWPAETGNINTASTELPLLVEVSLEAEGFGEVVRLFELTASP